MISLRQIIMEARKALDSEYRDEVLINVETPAEEVLEDCECNGMTIPPLDVYSSSQEELYESDVVIGERSADDLKGSEYLKNFGVI